MAVMWCFRLATNLLLSLCLLVKPGCSLFPVHPSFISLSLCSVPFGFIVPKLHMLCWSHALLFCCNQSELFSVWPTGAGRRGASQRSVQEHHHGRGHAAILRAGGGGGRYGETDLETRCFHSEVAGYHYLSGSVGSKYCVLNSTVSITNVKTLYRCLRKVQIWQQDYQVGTIHYVYELEWRHITAWHKYVCMHVSPFHMYTVC